MKSPHGTRVLEYQNPRGKAIQEYFRKSELRAIQDGPILTSYTPRKESVPLWTQLLDRTPSAEALSRSGSVNKTKLEKIYEFNESSRTINPTNQYVRPPQQSIFNKEQRPKKRVNGFHNHT